MFALDCDIYRGTQACLWSGLLRTFLPRHILWSLTVKRTRGYRVILTLKFFCIISSGRGKINFANHPHADIMFYWVIFTTLCGAIPETFKKKNKKFYEWFDEIVSHRSRNLNMYKRPFEYLLKKWSSTLYTSGKEKWCLKCPTIMVKANFTVLQYHVKKYPIRMSLSWLSKLILP